MSHDTVSIVELTLFYLSHFLRDVVPGEGRKLRADYLIADMRAKYPLFEYVFENPSECTSIVEDVMESQLSRVVSDLEGVIDSKLKPELDFELHSTRHLHAIALDIFGRIPLERMSEVTDSQDYDSFANKFAINLKTTYGLDLRRISSLANAYRTAVREPWHQPNSKLSLIDTVANYVHLPRAEHDVIASQEESSSLAIRWFSTAGIFPNRTVKIGIVAINTEHSVALQLCLVEKLSTSTRADLLVILAVGNSSGFAPEVRVHLSRDDTVLFPEDRLKEIGLAENAERAFRDALLSGLPLRLISPFKYSGPVGRDVFFGRQVELRRILETRATNFSIVGARQIGKSSLLHAIEREVNENKCIDNTVAIYIDTSTCRQMTQFCWTLIDAFSSVVSDDDNLHLYDSAEQRDVQGFLDCLLGILRRKRAYFLLLIDEVDDLLTDREADRFERFARTLANEGRVRFVLSGYRKLKERTIDRFSHLFNLVDQIYLGPLNEAEASSLVARSMDKIGVKFEGSTTVGHILKAGSTIPWLLQFCCDLLLRHLDHDDNRRVIRNDDVDLVSSGDQFTSRLCLIVEDVNMPDLDRIIVYACAAFDDEGISESAIVEHVRAHLYSVSFSQVRLALNYLVDTYVLTRDRSTYRFFISQLKLALQHREYDPDLVIRELASEYRQSINTT
jgi:hypothetical protein